MALKHWIKIEAMTACYIKSPSDLIFSSLSIIWLLGKPIRRCPCSLDVRSQSVSKGQIKSCYKITPRRGCRNNHVCIFRRNAVDDEEVPYNECDTHLSSAQEWYVLTRNHSFTCNPHAYPRMEWAIPILRVTALWPVLISRFTEDSRLSWPGGWLHTKVVCPPEDGHHSQY